MKNLYSSIKKQFFLSFQMLENLLNEYPDNLWDKVKGGFPIWQQILHVLEGVSYWMRLIENQYNYPFSNRNLFPDLDNIPYDILTKNELIDYQIAVKKQCEKYFNNINNDILFSDSIIDNMKTNLEVILIIIRHIQYHVGQLNCILRENKISPVDWVE